MGQQPEELSKILEAANTTLRTHHLFVGLSTNDGDANPFREQGRLVKTIDHGRYVIIGFAHRWRYGSSCKLSEFRT
jgi:hypothetical protein